MYYDITAIPWSQASRKKEEEAQSRFSPTRARMRILPKRSSRHHLHLQNLKNVKHLHHPPNSKPAHNFNNESSVNNQKTLRSSCSTIKVHTIQRCATEDILVEQLLLNYHDSEQSNGNSKPSPNEILLLQECSDFPVDFDVSITIDDITTT